VTDVAPFALVLAVVSAAGLLAVWSNRISERIRIPSPAIFLVAGALATELLPTSFVLPVVTVQRVVTVMLILLLFEGGMHIGWRRFRSAAGAVLWVGVAGTLVTAVGVAVLCHLALGFDWRPSVLLGVALAPTDPAVVFSVLGRREVSGRSGTLLEGESGANDPVGIAAMAAVLSAGTTGGWPVVGDALGEFALQMTLGLAAGAAGGYLLARMMRRMPLPNGALYPLQTLLAAGAIYGLATVVHGSGFLAVFVAGIIVGDVRAPYKAEIERFHASLASLAEIVAFALLGLTVTLSDLADDHTWLVGLALALMLALVVRPVLVGLLLRGVDLSRGERVFVLWSGLKGAVPILLGTYILTDGGPEAGRLYGVVVVVVAFSVVVQGGLVPTVARRSGVPMRTVEPEPWP
jgi:cell volume regulation protein A